MQVFSRTKSSWDMFGFWQTTFCMLDEGPEHKHLCFQDSLLLIYCRLHTNLYPCVFKMFSCSLWQIINGECGPKRVFSNFFPSIKLYYACLWAIWIRPANFKTVELSELVPAGTDDWCVIQTLSLTDTQVHEKSVNLWFRPFGLILDLVTVGQIWLKPLYCITVYWKSIALLY